jgi:phosphoribosylformimino-5-aminoimidazole carboxamide ribotide isomerase
MRIIPVIDLLHGQVVRGIGGKRSEYRPIHSQLVSDARPKAVATAFVEYFGFDTTYVADLNAIMEGPWSANDWKQVASSGLKLCLDAGITNSLAAQKILACGIELDIDLELVIGLESLESPSELANIQQLCRGQAIFSLDMRAGEPLTKIESWQSRTPIEIAAEAVNRGTNRLIILDLADVGESGGTRTLQLCRDLRENYPYIELIAGGGVRNLDDLKALSDAGASAALVASALHNRRLTPHDIRQLESQHS